MIVFSRCVTYLSKKKTTWLPFSILSCPSFTRLIYDSLTTQVDGSRRSISAAECSPLSAVLLKLGEQKGRSSILGERRGSLLLAKQTLLQAAA